MGTKDWDAETYRSKLEKTFFTKSNFEIPNIFTAPEIRKKVQIELHECLTRIFDDSNKMGIMGLI